MSEKNPEGSIMIAPTVLVIAPEYPYPADSGSKLAIASSLALLHEAGWQIVLVMIVTHEQTAVAQKRVPAPFPLETRVFSRETRYTTHVDTDLDMSMQVVIDRERPALIWVEHAQLAPLIKEVETRGAAVWFRSINFELLHRWEKSSADFRENSSGRSGRKLLSHLREMGRLLSVAYQWERQMHQVADRIWHISYREQQLLPRLYGRKPIATWMPPILERSAVDIQPHDGPLNVLYMGSRYDDFQNRSSALYLLQTLIPAIEQAYPGGFHFHLTGKFARERLSAAAQGFTNVTLHDYVPDLTALIHKTDIFCLPVQMGWGCKLKMLEGLAYGLPVIGAWQVFRGVPPEKNLFLSCRTVDDYRRAFGRLQSIDARRTLGRAGFTAYQRWCDEGKEALFRALAGVNPSMKLKALRENRHMR
jgi:hypothetical protein